MIRFEGPPRDAQGATIEELCLIGSSEAITHDGEVVEGICDVRMRQTQTRFLEPENPTKGSLRSRVVPGGCRLLRLADDTFDLAKLRHDAGSLKGQSKAGQAVPRPNSPR